MINKIRLSQHIRNQIRHGEYGMRWNNAYVSKQHWEVCSPERLTTSDEDEWNMKTWSFHVNDTGFWFFKKRTVVLYRGYFRIELDSLENDYLVDLFDSCVEDKMKQRAKEKLLKDQAKKDAAWWP